MVTELQKEVLALFEALEFTIRGIRVYIVAKLDPKNLGGWELKFRNAIDLNKQEGWDISLTLKGNKTIADLIDYNHLSSVSKNLKRDLYNDIDNKTAKLLESWFDELFSIRNDIMHFNWNYISANRFTKAWIHLEEIAIIIKDDTLLDRINDLRKEIKEEEKTTPDSDTDLQILSNTIKESEEFNKTLKGEMHPIENVQLSLLEITKSLISLTDNIYQLKGLSKNINPKNKKEIEKQIKEIESTEKVIKNSIKEFEIINKEINGKDFERYAPGNNEDEADKSVIADYKKQIEGVETELQEIKEIIERTRKEEGNFNKEMVIGICILIVVAGVIFFVKLSGVVYSGDKGNTVDSLKDLELLSKLESDLLTLNHKCKTEEGEEMKQKMLAIFFDPQAKLYPVDDVGLMPMNEESAEDFLYDIWHSCENMGGIKFFNPNRSHKTGKITSIDFHIVTPGEIFKNSEHAK